MKFAFFDFDNTVISGDSIVSFMLFCYKEKKLSLLHLIRTVFSFLCIRISGKDFTSTKEVSLSFMRGKSKEEIESLCMKYVQNVIKPQIRTKALAEMELLRQEGYKILVVSASTSCYMGLLPQLMPVDQVLATEMIYENGVFSGRIGPNCKGEEKVRRISQYLNNLYQPADLRHSVAYGDSDSDVPMLHMTGTAYLISPSVKTRKKHPEIPVKEWKVI